MKSFRIMAFICVCLLFPAWGWSVQLGTQSVANNNDTVYVSSQGDDNQWNGTIASPYYSLNKAVEGRVGTADSADTLFVLVAAGDYYMTEPFSVQSGSSRPVVIQAVGKEKPRFLGGIPITGWEKCENGMYRAYIPEVSRFGLRFEQFYVNGKRAVLARTPNQGWFQVKKSKEQPLVPGERLARYAVQRIDLHPADGASLSGLTQEELNHLKFRFLP